ncbi:MAG: fatty acid desaturase [Gammaproteobacteria bacterium]|nr:fatty acid desaturase [Gammaproteobacteria bacterium]
MPALFRYNDALWPNLLAISYVLASYVAGLALMLSAVFTLNIIGVIVFAHGMIIAAYLIHECAHNSLFRKNSYHRWLAELLLWICGASYSHYDDVRHKHVRHHTDKADVVSFDFRLRFKNYPKTLKVIQALEWCYIPAMELLMHALVIVLPFIKDNRKHLRSRIVMVVFLRGLFFAYLASISLPVLFYYSLSYLLFLTVMRFMDAHQHTYELYETLDQKRGDEAKKYDRDFEQKNTYSNLLSVKQPWINLLVLNFSYHNAHHQQPGRPWYQLPALHNELYASDDRQVLSFKALIKSYHRFRVQRITNEDAINLPVKKMQEQFIGVDGVSFLTAH